MLRLRCQICSWEVCGGGGGVRISGRGFAKRGFVYEDSRKTKKNVLFPTIYFPHK